MAIFYERWVDGGWIGFGIQTAILQSLLHIANRVGSTYIALEN